MIFYALGRSYSDRSDLHLRGFYFYDVKRNSAGFTHQSLVTGHGDYCCICGKKKEKSLKPHLVSFEIASVGAEDYKL